MPAFLFVGEFVLSSMRRDGVGPESGLALFIRPMGVAVVWSWNVEEL